MRAGLALTALVFAVPSQLPARGQQQPLPRTGFAVQTATGVVLVDPAGHVARTLTGYRFRDQGVERAGQIELRDASGRDFELRGGQIVRVPGNSVTLPYGWSLEFASQWILRQGARVVVRYAGGTHLGLDASGALLSALPPKGGPTVLRDLRSGTRRTLPAGCRAGALVGTTEYDLCGYPYAKTRDSTIVRVDPAGGRRVLAGPAQARQTDPAGWWRQVVPGPPGTPLLAQWSGVCEVPSAYLVDRDTGKRSLLRDRGGHAVEGRILGWIGGTPFAALPHSVCTSSAEPPGIYEFDATGRPLLVYRLRSAASVPVAFWR